MTKYFFIIYIYVIYTKHINTGNTLFYIKFYFIALPTSIYFNVVIVVCCCYHFAPLSCLLQPACSVPQPVEEEEGASPVSNSLGCSCSCGPVRSIAELLNGRQRAAATAERKRSLLEPLRAPNSLALHMADREDPQKCGGYDLPVVGSFRGKHNSQHTNSSISSCSPPGLERSAFTELPTAGGHDALLRIN